MSIRFAAPPQAMTHRLRGAAARAAVRQSANDNGASESGDSVIRASLRHFAEHGLAAAAHARAKAQDAWFAGDRDTYRWWLNICRTLDRRMARELARLTEAAG